MQPAASKKGLSFVAARDYAQHDDPAGWEAALRALDPADAEALRGVVAIGWYPLALYARTLRAIDRALGDGSLSTVRRLGRFEAERNVPTIHRVLLRMVKATLVVEKMAELWPRYNSTGSASVERRGPKDAELTIRDWSDDAILCMQVHGYAERALELAGARDVHVTQTGCRARGAPACVFHVAWR